MKFTNKLGGMLFIIAGVLFILSALIGRDYLFIPVGFSFVVLGSVFGKIDDKNKSEQGKEK